MIPQEDPITPPTTADVRDMESSSLEVQGVHNTTPSSFGYPPEEEAPPSGPITSPTEDDVKHTLPGPAETLLGSDAMVLLMESDVKIQKDLPTNWAISPIKVETQVVPTTRLVVKLAGPLAPSDQADEERRCVLIVTASMGRLNLEATGVTLRDMVTASVWRVAFKNPQMAAVPLGPTKWRKVVGSQDTTVEELAGKDLAGDHL